MATRLPTGTVTFVFTDVERSTLTAERLGHEYPDALARHHRALRAAFGAHAGREVGVFEGDAIFVVFERASDAVAAALDAQRRLGEDDAGLRVRIGMHTGEAQILDDSYVGVDVHRAKRVCSAAHGGQVLLSSATRELAHRRMPDGATLLDLGVRRLKDLGEPERLYQLAHPDLRSSFPSPRTLDVLPNNLPLELTTFVGREREIADVTGILSSTRLVTLLGAGGVGKTRLALHVGAEVLDANPNGVWMADLSPVSGGALVASEIAAAVGATTDIVEHLRNSTTLLILDNCEHIVSACAELVGSILRTCPRVTILATSREPLGVAGEAVYLVPPLSTTEAARLFVDRARLRLSGFHVSPENAAAVSAIAIRLDGLPLAIELAAAQAGVLSPAEIASRLDDQLALKGVRTAVDRHQTLRAAMDWSYELLDDSERTLFRRLAIFPGGFTLDAVARVCEVNATIALGLVTALVDKSLVLRVDQPSSATRYRMLESVRQYGLEKLGRTPNIAPSATTATAAMRLEGDVWTITFDGRTVRLKDSRGLRHLAVLVAHPGREYHALDLASPGMHDDGDAGASIDPAARDAYRARLADLEEELSEATAWSDDVRAERARDEIDRLVRELSASVGLGGRVRTTGSASERARTAVRKALTSTIERIESVHPELGRHLKVAVRTGIFCSYTPDPRAPIAWET